MSRGAREAGKAVQVKESGFSVYWIHRVAMMGDMKLTDYVDSRVLEKGCSSVVGLMYTACRSQKLVRSPKGMESRKIVDVRTPRVGRRGRQRRFLKYIT